MTFSDVWNETKLLVQQNKVTVAYVCNVLSIERIMAECLINDWKELFIHEMNNELRKEEFEHY